MFVGLTHVKDFGQDADFEKFASVHYDAIPIGHTVTTAPRQSFITPSNGRVDNYFFNLKKSRIFVVERAPSGGAERLMDTLRIRLLKSVGATRTVDFEELVVDPHHASKTVVFLRDFDGLIDRETRWSRPGEFSWVWRNRFRAQGPLTIIETGNATEALNILGRDGSLPYAILREADTKFGTGKLIASWNPDLWHHTRLKEDGGREVDAKEPYFYAQHGKAG